VKSGRLSSAGEAVQRVKPIEEIEVGDLVWAWDNDRSALVKRRVKQVFRRKDRPVLQVLCIDDAATVQVITATTEHPFWIEGKGWVAAHALQPGETLKCIDGAPRMSVLRVEDTGARADVFNFEVEETHNYFVGTHGILVHNESSPAGWNSPDIIRAIEENPVVRATSRRLQAKGVTIEVDSTLPADTAATARIGDDGARTLRLNPSKIGPFEQGFPRTMGEVLAHEGDKIHVATMRRGLRPLIETPEGQGTQYGEYRALVKEEMARRSAVPGERLRPTLDERREIWAEAQDLYPNLRMGRSPFGLHAEIQPMAYGGAGAIPLELSAKARLTPADELSPWAGRQATVVDLEPRRPPPLISQTVDRIWGRIQGHLMVDPSQLSPTEITNPAFLTGGVMSAPYVNRVQSFQRGWDWDAKPIEAVNIDGRLYIMDGHKRTRAAIEAGLGRVPVKIVPVGSYDWPSADAIMQAATRVANGLDP